MSSWFGRVRTVPKCFLGSLAGGIYSVSRRFTDAGRELEMVYEHEGLPEGRLTARGFLPRTDQPAARWDRAAGGRTQLLDDRFRQWASAQKPSR